MFTWLNAVPVSVSSATISLVLLGLSVIVIFAFSVVSHKQIYPFL